uniref:hypothetical protein n=1 Tax=Magnusiomyces fungicola TaxID=1734004 RepID=UPI001BED9978|nr:hypothetical protein MFQ77_mgp18 [Saprochaete fungicola]QUV75090.1 hypothetical protein [Saprochaete fungicola]
MSFYIRYPMPSIGVPRSYFGSIDFGISDPASGTWPHAPGFASSIDWSWRAKARVSRRHPTKMVATAETTHSTYSQIAIRSSDQETETVTKSPEMVVSRCNPRRCCRWPLSDS